MAPTTFAVATASVGLSPRAIFGGVMWITSLVYAGYFFGNIPWVKQNLSLIVVGIVVVSLIPAVVTFLHERRKRPSP